MMDDVRYAFRQLRAHPAFAVVAVATLAVGVGSASAMFGLIQGVLLSPPPFVEPRVWRVRRVRDRADETTPGNLTTSTDEATDAVVVEPRTWLARVGWRRHGLVGLGERPRG